MIGYGLRGENTEREAVRQEEKEKLWPTVAKAGQINKLPGNAQEFLFGATAEFVIVAGLFERIPKRRQTKEQAEFGKLFVLCRLNLAQVPDNPKGSIVLGPNAFTCRVSVEISEIATMSARHLTVISEKKATFDGVRDRAA